MNRRHGRGYGSDTSERSQQPRPEQAGCQRCHRHPGWGRARSQVTKADEPPPHPAMGVLRAAPCSQETRPAHTQRDAVRVQPEQNETGESAGDVLRRAHETRRDGGARPHRAQGSRAEREWRGHKAPSEGTSEGTASLLGSKYLPTHSHSRAGKGHAPSHLQGIPSPSAPPVEETGKTCLWGHPLAALQASLGQPGPAPCRRERPGWTRARGGGETCPPSCEGSSRAPPCPPGRQTPPAPFPRGASGGPGRACVRVHNPQGAEHKRGPRANTSSPQLKPHARACQSAAASPTVIAAREDRGRAESRPAHGRQGGAHPEGGIEVDVVGSAHLVILLLRAVQGGDPDGSGPV